MCGLHTSFYVVCSVCVCCLHVYVCAVAYVGLCVCELLHVCMWVLSHVCVLHVCLYVWVYCHVCELVCVCSCICVCVTTCVHVCTGIDVCVGLYRYTYVYVEYGGQAQASFLRLCPGLEHGP